MKQHEMQNKKQAQHNKAFHQYTTQPGNTTNQYINTQTNNKTKQFTNTKQN